MTSYPLNDGWFFIPEWNEECAVCASPEKLPAPAGEELVDAAGLRPVRLPHSVAELPLDCFDDADYQMLSGYLRLLDVPQEWLGGRVRLVLEGAAHRAEVFCNGVPVGVHSCGWTAGVFDLSGALHAGPGNIIAVRLDSRESLDQPPFGGVVDYLTYGGLYREARLEVTGPARIEDHVIRADHLGRLSIDAQIADERRAPATGAGSAAESQADAPEPESALTLRVRIETLEGALLAQAETPVCDGAARIDTEATGVEPWSPSSPVLHRVRLLLIDEDEARSPRGEAPHSRDGEPAPLDERGETIGFRSVDWRAEGLYINGAREELRGLNRHQSWPVMGYAVPARAQRLDADILKNELGCTLVRTSHYPQSHHFIDRCDELGLLVITEIPGWQHIGGAAWKERAVENTRDMVRQWRHHPSIIAWGVRINESPDDDGLYARTNAAARELDPTRPTTGIRNFAKSHLLEDVYAYNDFLHSGDNPGCSPKRRITPDTGKGYLISEHNGHMFPTKAFDDEEHRLSQAMRHARVHDDAAGAEGVAGAIGWCMSDYQTHRDFGSGDQICHHGVMDAYRNPKLAAALYSSQALPTLVPSSSMDIGEHPGGAIGPIEVFTDADEVRLYRNGEFVGSFTPNRGDFPNLAHPPVRIDDTIGSLLETHEGMDRRTSERVKRILRDAARYGASGLPTRTKLAAALLMATKRFTAEDATRLYNTWMASWGAESVLWRFDALKGGVVVDSVERGPARGLRLEARVDSTRLEDGDTWDLASVRIRALDEHGAPRVYAHRVVRLSLSGDAELVGPAQIPLIGGACGTYVKTLGRAGSARLSIDCEGAEPITIDFQIACKEAPTWN